MIKYKYHILYKTTNLINGKIYVGIHSSNKLKDKYKGSGWAFKRAVKKYGVKNFKRENLLVLPSREEAVEVEMLLVSGKYLFRGDNYNLAEGGGGTCDQWGEKNPMFGRRAPNAKKVKAVHKDGREFVFDSIQDCADFVYIDRANVRNLIKKGIFGRRGWKVTKI